MMPDVIICKKQRYLAHIEGIRVELNEGGNSIVLRRGSFGDAVRELQELLKVKGFELAIDSDFGPATELAVMVLQKNNDLIVDVIVGRNTWK